MEKENGLICPFLSIGQEKMQHCIKEACALYNNDCQTCVINLLSNIIARYA